ncbi:hypothetical protein AMECASPLE_024395 [Ameca splendens]|uniref:Uncharacterized protein n=1 Tax=Ameca splendens TaxID=208324 RepID=A0ABV0Y4D5_9TELE
MLSGIHPSKEIKLSLTSWYEIALENPPKRKSRVLFLKKITPFGGITLSIEFDDILTLSTCISSQAHRLDSADSCSCVVWKLCFAGFTHHRNHLLLQTQERKR